MSKITSSYCFTAFPNWIFQKAEAEEGWMDYKEMIIILVLQSFANGIGGSPVVYPSIRKISKMTGMDRKTIMAAMKRLVEKGVIEKETRYEDGARKSNLYKLNIWNHEPPKGFEIAETTEAPDTESLGPEKGTDDIGGAEYEPGGSKPDLGWGISGTGGGGKTAQEQYPSNNNQEQNIGETENSNKNSRQQQLLKKVLKALEPLPDNIRIESKLITEWLLKRKARHRLDPEITSRSLKALEEAKKLNVLSEYCEIAAERGWSSLGFVGYAEFLEKLSKEKNPTCNNAKPRQTIIKPRATLH